MVVNLKLKAQTLKNIEKLTGTLCYDFLGFTLDLQEGTITDNLGQPMQSHEECDIQSLSTLLTHYGQADPKPLTSRLVKYKDLPGGYAYEAAFIRRAIQPIADVFGENPEELLEATKRLGGSKLNHGDASVVIDAFSGVPLTYILWRKEEFPASANILYDESASYYLPTEDLAVLGEITTKRLIQAKRDYFG